jgi:3-oxoacyl-[acyl-carrier-protein] synthase II
MAVKIGVFGWGIVAPKSPNISAFRNNLKAGGTWLAPFNGFGPDNFLVGTPEFRFEDYQDWIDSRFAPRHFQKLREKMDQTTLFAVGAFLQALQQNEGMERELKELGTQAHVYVGTGLGSVGTQYDVSIALYKAQQRWDEFWAAPERNAALREYLTRPQDTRQSVPEAEWNHYWMAHSPELAEYLVELADIDGLLIHGEVETGKLNAMREKDKRHTRLREKWQAPEPPWNVSANMIWNIHNAPAAQISILARTTGLSFAPVAACSTFGVALKLGMQAIQAGEAKLVVVGATDPPPHPLTVGAFYSARVSSADARLSIPLTRLQGTHVAGGSAVWIIGDFDYLTAKGFRPLGMEPLAVGVSSDAYHIITPSLDGPKAAIANALAGAGATPEDIATWDLHATATPGDSAEVSTFRSIFPGSVLVTARKGTFGHGMSAGGGWELTAQYLAYEAGQLFPTTLPEGELNTLIGAVHNRFVFDTACPTPDGLAGKLSMGIGGVNACVISRPLK